VRRILDVCVAGFLLAASAPLLALIAGAVRLSGAEPVLYRSSRVGRHGHPMQILKFRTMDSDPAWKRDVTSSDDPRITRLGRLLRRSKLDELPQLFNVLRGEMSMVGPRPESPRYVAHYTAEQQEVLSVLPGITGVAQLLFRNEEQLLSGAGAEGYYIRELMPAKLRVDLAYVRHRSLWLDFKILLLTGLTLLAPEAPSWRWLQIRFGSTSMSSAESALVGVRDGALRGGKYEAS
jgi:lipopolysaccharide/colanic/teichoic acid biosynthesis glycosyltransferase